MPILATNLPILSSGYTRAAAPTTGRQGGNIWFRLRTPRRNYYYQATSEAEARALLAREHPEDSKPNLVVNVPESQVPQDEFLRTGRKQPVAEGVAKTIPAPVSEKVSATASGRFGGVPVYPSETTSPTAPPPSSQAVMDDFVKLYADLIDKYTEEQNKALADIGVTNFDENKVREEVLADPAISKYLKSQADVLAREVKEGRIRTQNDYNYRMQAITDNVNNRLKEVSITQARTDEELKNRLADIGATTQFNLAQATQRWNDRIRAEEQSQLQRGRGFSGVMKEQMAGLEQQKTRELAELQRRGTVSQQTAETTAKYDQQQAQAARENVQAYKTRETGRAGVLQQRGVREFGTEGGQIGYHEKERQAQLQRAKETLIMQEIEQRRREALQEQQMARSLALKQAQFPDISQVWKKYRTKSA